MPDPNGVLADAAARERIRRSLDETLFVEAGAGTGKTSALVGRITEILRGGRAELSEIAAITFTEAAAAELRSRLHDALVRSDDAQLVARAKEIEDATITTIHGFAQRLLTEFPIESGLPLRFEVLDEIAGSLEFERRFAAFLDALYEEYSLRSVLLGAIALGIGVTPLRELARAIEERADPSLVAGGVGPDPGRELEELVVRAAASVRGLAAAAVPCRGDCRELDDALVERLSQLEAAVEAFDPEADWLDRLRWLVALRPQRVGRVGRREAWGDIELTRAAVGAFEESRESSLRSIGELVATALAARLGEEARAAAADRRARGRLRFHDLLVLARDLLADHPGVRRALRSRYRYLLVDEFQDTDPLQLEMILLLGSETGAPDPGRLFFVGDPKQSIYSFRGAQLSLYEQTRSELVGGEPTRLVTNFRSVPGVLGYVNELFARLFSARATIEHSRAADLVAAREPFSPTAVMLLGGPDQAATAWSRRAADAAEIAATIRLALEEGWPIHDGESERPLRARDVAILLPARTGLPQLEEALEDAAIEYRVAHSTLIYASVEVRELLALLAAIDEPGDERVLLAALRTAPAGCSDVDLAKFRQIGGTWRLGSPAPDGAPSTVRDALACLVAASSTRHGQSADATLELLITAFSVRQLLSVKRNRIEALRRVEFLLDRARAFTAATGGSIAEFLSFAEREAEIGTRGVELLAADGEVDAVRILTVHGAKGLEFPFVVLADLGGPARSQPNGAALIRRANGSVEFRLASGSATAGFDEAMREEVELANDEALRLAYVGATRARDYLVLALGHRPSTSGAPSIAELIWTASGELAGAWRSLAAARPETVQIQTLWKEESDADEQPRAVEESSVPVDLATWRARREELLSWSRRPRRVTPSSLEAAPTLALRVAPIARLSLEDEDEESPWRRPRQASAVGRAVHAVLQQMDLADPQSAERLSRIAAENEGVSSEAPRIATLARQACSTGIVRQAIAAGRTRRELPFRMPIATGFLEGVVDLCFVEDGSLVIVDYKTDALSSPSELGRAADRYRLQVGSYALGLSSSTGLPVARAILVFLAPPDGALEYEFEELEVAMADAKLAVERLLIEGLETIAR